MADIAVTLVLDDSQYTGKLKAAGNAADEFGAKAKKATSEGSSGLEAMGVSVEGLHRKFEALQVAILGVGLAEFVKSAIEYADKIEDMSKATGMTIPQIVEFQRAVQAAGGNAEGAAKGIQNFYAKIDEARQGSGQVQFAFSRLGVSLNDLSKMSDQKIFYTTIDELARMPAGAEQARLATELLGKTFKGLSIQEVAEKLKEMRGKFDDTGASIQAAADLNKKLEESFSNLKIAALEVFQPIIEALGGMESSGETARKVIVGITIAFGAFAGLKVAEMIMGVVEACILLKEALFAVATAEAAATGGISTLLGLLVKFGIGAAAAVATSIGIDKMAESSAKAKEKAKELNDEMVKNQNKPQNNKVLDAGAAMVASINAQIKAFRDQIQAGNEKIANDTRLIGSSQDFVKEEQARLAIQQEIAKKIEELEAKKREAALKPGGTAPGEVAAYSKQIAQLKKDEAALVEGRVAGIKALNAAEKAERDYQMILSDGIATRNRVIDLQNGAATLSLSKTAAGYVQIEQAAKKAAQAEIDAEMARRGSKGEVPLTEQELQAYFDRHARLADAEKSALAQYNDQARSFTTGWEAAFNQYVDDATNAANKAQSMFQSMTTNMNSALDKFVDTGKFSFSDLANSIVKDLIKIELKASVSQLFGALSGGGGGGGGGGFSLGGLMNMFKASGGDVTAGTPYIVGEKGPEMFVPSAAGSIVPNSALNTGSAGRPSPVSPTYVNYTINAVDSASFKAMIAADPSFIYAVTQQGSKMLPQTSR